MSITHETRIQYAGGGTQTCTVSNTSEGEDNRDIPLAIGATNIEVAIALVLARIQSIFIVSDKDVTLKTNDSGSPVDTFTLKANKPLLWFVDSPMDLPFTMDITKLFFSNGSGSAAVVKIRSLFDATP